MAGVCEDMDSGDWILAIIYSPLCSDNSDMSVATRFAADNYGQEAHYYMASCQPWTGSTTMHRYPWEMHRAGASRNRPWLKSQLWIQNLHADVACAAQASVPMC